ncbi:reverse transcriptase domain-containing protein [Tanacetum coccineum]
MHTRASNYELVEPLPEPERTLNQRLRRRNRRVPYDQRNNPPQHPRIVYLPILNINYIRYFLDILRNYDPMDDEPMWAADRVVAPTPGSVITIPETANEFAIKVNHLTLVKGNQFDGRTKTNPHKHIHEFLRIYDMFKYRDTENEAVCLMMFPLALTGEAKTWLDELNEGTIETWDELRTAFISRFFPPTLFDRLLAKNEKTKSSLKKTVAFADEGNSNTDADKIMAHMDAMTIKMDAQYKELQSRAKQPTPDLDDDDMPMSRKEEDKFMQTFRKTRFYNDYSDRDSNRDNWCSSGRNDYNRDNYRSNTDDKPYDLQKQFNDFMKSQQSTNTFVKETFMDLKTQLETVDENMLVEVGKFTFLADFVILEMEEDNKVPLILGQPFLHTADAVIRVKQKQLNLGVGTELMIFNIDSAMQHSYSNNNTCFSIDVINEILEDFDALLDEESKILHSIERTLLEEEIFSELDEFMAMTADENSESDIEEPPFEKITINTDYKIKTSLEKPPMDLELKPLPDNLEYVFLEELSFLLVIISSKLSAQNKSKLVSVLKKHKEAFAWKTTEIPGECLSGYANAPATFQRCMLAIFHDMIEESVERCKDAHLILNWEKCHFMVKEGIVLRHKVSGAGLEVDKAKINVISKLPPLTNIKYTPFEFDDECQKAFELLKEKLTCAPVIVSPNCNLPFELMYDASDFTVGAVLGRTLPIQEAVSTPMVAAAKLLVLNPGDFELWKMRIKQYFLMTDYALWEVILNGDSPPPKKTIDGVEQTYPPLPSHTTAGKES